MMAQNGNQTPAKRPFKESDSSLESVDGRSETSGADVGSTDSSDASGADEPAAENTQPASGSGPVRLAIPLGIAVIGGVFVALGVEGEALGRLIRNSPGFVAGAMTLAVLGVSVPLLFGGVVSGRWLPKILAVAGSLLLILGTIVAIWYGSHGVGIREQPDIEFEQLGPVASDSSVTFKVTATGLSLRSDDHLLLRVLAFRTSDDPTQRSDLTGPVCYDSSRVPPPGGRVLVWAEGGPSVDGTVSTTATVTVSRKEFTHLCALAVLNNQESQRRTTPSMSPSAQADTTQARGAQPRITGSILDLRGATASPSTSATPSASTTGSNKKSSLVEEGFTFLLTPSG